MIILILFIFFILSVFSRGMYRTIINPLFIFTAVNGFSIILSLLMDDFHGYSDHMYIYIFIMFISFFLGAKLGEVKNYTYKNTIHRSYTQQLAIKRIILCSSIIYDIALVFYLRNLFAQYSIYQFFTNMGEVNHYVQSDDYKSGWFSYVVALGIPLSLLILYYGKEYKKNVFLIAQYILCFMHCISPRRSDMFNFIIITGIYLLSVMKVDSSVNIKKVKKRIGVWSIIIGILFIGVMVITQDLLGKTSTNSLSILGYTLPTYLVDPYTYFSLNYPYIEQMRNSDLTSCTVPLHSSCRLFYIISNGLGITHVDTLSAFALDFANIGNVTTNTAPMLYYAFKDFGYLFFLFFIIWGFIGQKAYYALNSGSISGRMFGCYIYCMLLLSSRSYMLIYLTFALALFYIFIYSRIIPKTE